MTTAPTKLIFQIWKAGPAQGSNLVLDPPPAHRFSTDFSAGKPLTRISSLKS